MVVMLSFIDCIMVFIVIWCYVFLVIFAIFTKVCHVFRQFFPWFSTALKFKGRWTRKLTYHFPKIAQFSENFDSSVGTQCFVNAEKFAFEIGLWKWRRKHAAMMSPPGDVTHVKSCCRADHALPDHSVLWSPDELCWAHFVFPWFS